MTTLKRKRVKLAKLLRRALKLDLPESKKLAKLCLNHSEVLSPYATLLRECGDGCCTMLGLKTPRGYLRGNELRRLVASV